jgi:hypothetical protein
MKKMHAIILAGFICILMIAAGCTSTSGTKPVTTTPAATTAAVTPSVPATVATAAPLVTPSWSGTWNTTYTSSDNTGTVVDVLSLTQNGSSVTGTYNNGIGLVNATEQGGRLTGSWSDSDKNGKYIGLFEFVRSADDKSFTGKWVYTSEADTTLGNSTKTWNGVRI